METKGRSWGWALTLPTLLWSRLQVPSGRGGVGHHHLTWPWVLLWVLPRRGSAAILAAGTRIRMGLTREALGDGEGRRSARLQPCGEGGVALGWFPQSLLWRPLGSWDRDGLKERDGAGEQGRSSDLRRAEARLPGTQSEVLLGICPPPSPEIMGSPARQEWRAPPCSLPPPIAHWEELMPPGAQQPTKERKCLLDKYPEPPLCCGKTTELHVLCPLPVPLLGFSSIYSFWHLLQLGPLCGWSLHSCLTAPLPHRTSRDHLTNKLTCVQILNLGDHSYQMLNTLIALIIIILAIECLLCVKHHSKHTSNNSLNHFDTL